MNITNSNLWVGIRNVFPSFVMKQHRYGAVRDAEPFSNLTLLQSFFKILISNIRDIRFFQLRVGYTRPFQHRSGVSNRSVPSPSRIPALCSHILHVVLMAANEKMIGSNTRGVVATMQNKQSFRNLTEVQLPGDSMGKRHLLSEASVATRHSISFPNPASPRLLDLRPESFFQWFSTIWATRIQWVSHIPSIAQQALK